MSEAVFGYMLIGAGAIALDDEDQEILEGGKKKVVTVEPDDVEVGDTDEDAEDGDIEEE